MGGSRAALRLAQDERPELEERGRSGVEWLRVASLFGLAASLLALVAAALGV